MSSSASYLSMHTTTHPPPLPPSRCTLLQAEDIARRAMAIAADIDVFTNHEVRTNPSSSLNSSLCLKNRVMSSTCHYRLALCLSETKALSPLFSSVCSLIISLWWR